MLRTTHGDCAGVDAAPAMAWVAAAGCGARGGQVPGPVETLAVGRPRPGRVVRDRRRRRPARSRPGPAAPAAPRSRASIPEGAWYLDPANDQRVVSPRGAVTVRRAAAPPRAVQAQRPLRHLLCDDGSAARADRAERRFVADAASEASAGLASHEDGRVASADGETTACGAMLQVVDEDGWSTTLLRQRQGRLGDAWTGDGLVAQLGYDLYDETTETGEPRA